MKLVLKKIYKEKKRMPFMKTTSILLSMPILMSLLFAVDGDVMFAPTPEPLPPSAPIKQQRAGIWKSCVPQCMPICMRLHGATPPACDDACKGGCLQIIGKGGVDFEFEYDN